jgi:hypothetical protein
MNTYIFKQCKFSNNLLTIHDKNTGKGFVYKGDCISVTSIFTRDKKKYLHINITCPYFLSQLSSLMNDMNDCVKHKLINEDQIIGKVPVKYGHIQIPLSNNLDEKIISSSIKPNNKLIVKITATSVWINHDEGVYGINWLFEDIRLIVQ